MKEKIYSLIDELNKVILGNQKQIILSVICLLARGHLLIEDLPGTGKSTLSKSLAKCIGLDSKSVHFVLIFQTSFWNDFFTIWDRLSNQTSSQK